ncbi:unnamed protein product [Arctia plantaginis]|uniref:Uncharacterized protein n=1 Tax=Arctia plantaginis TaxID=874455 RepID=A0A8S1AA92_ARCPL|nr:unnamed protein product [Arctia plantaginis]CAB3242282.1 unnamed protein product [Arctia plantaginis]
MCVRSVLSVSIYDRILYREVLKTRVKFIAVEGARATLLHALAKRTERWVARARDAVIEMCERSGDVLAYQRMPLIARLQRARVADHFLRCTASPVTLTAI